MTEVYFEYLCTRKNKYAEIKDTEQLCLEDIDFKLTLKDIFETLKSRYLNYNFKTAENYHFIYLGEICDINKSLNTLNIPVNGSIMMLNNKITTNNVFISNLMKFFTSVSSTEIENNLNQIMNNTIVNTPVNLEIQEQDYETYKEQLITLENMGFIEKETNLHSLKRTGGDINRAVEWILGLD